jgi:predicted nuclease of predicted toxin-antitoxin system
MARFLANENLPHEAVAAARQAGTELASIREDAPGASDEMVLERAQRNAQVLVTFDKDFGELAFRRGRQAAQGVILLRPRLRSPEYLADFLVRVLQQPIDWQGHFAVADEGRIRVVPLPESTDPA